MRCIISKSCISRWLRVGWMVGILAFAGCFGGERSLKRADGYHLTPPAGWKVTDEGKSDRSYRLKSGTIVAVTSSCERHADADLNVLTRHLLIGLRDLAFSRQFYLEVAGSRGLYSSVTARGGERASKPIYFEIFVISKADCIFDFTMLNRAPFTERELGEFKTFLKSFRYGPSKGT